MEVFWLFSLFVSWIALSIAVTIIAESRDRVGFGWFCFSFLINPVIGLVFVLGLPNLRRRKTEKRRHDELLAAIRGDAPAPVTD